jgi:hypothetical protein
MVTADQTPRRGTSVDESRIVQAMAVWDQLTAAEQREVFRGVAEAVSEFGRAKDIDVLVTLAERVNGMVRAESHPGFTEARRRPPEPPGGPDVGPGTAELIRQLRE